MSTAVTIKLHRDSASNWAGTNPILNAGEPGVELDTGKLKVGDGTSHWNDLPYTGSGGAVDGIAAADATIVVGGSAEEPSLKVASGTFDAYGLAATEEVRATAAEALLAPLASPALTGSPTAPTKTALDNSTKIATTAYADAATAVEQSRAETAEALLAPLASPALTGSPTAPTQSGGDSSTKVATTAFVAGATVVGGDITGTLASADVATVKSGKTPVSLNDFLGVSQVVRPSGDSTGATDATNIQAALNGGTNTSIYLNGNYTVNATMLIPSGITVILADAHITLAASVDRPVFANTSYQSSTASESNIAIRGFGRAIIDGNNTNNTETLSYAGTCMTFVAVQELSIRDVQTQYATGNHYQLQGCTNVRVHNIKGVINSTDHGFFHTDVGCQNVAIDGVQCVGTFTDSVFSINTVYQTTGSFSPWAQAATGSTRNITGISFRNIQISSGSGMFCFWVDGNATISAIDISNVLNTYTSSTSGEEIQVGYAGYDSVSLSAQASITGMRVNGYTFGGTGHVLCQVNNAVTDLQFTNIRGIGTVTGLLSSALAPNTGVQAGYYPQMQRVKFSDVVIQTLTGPLCDVPAGYWASDIEFENITIGTANGAITKNGCDVTGLKIRGLKIGTLNAAPFQDTGTVTGEVNGFTYDAKGASLTALLPTQVQFKIGQPFPPLSAADTTPSPVAGSRIACFAGKDPTGGSNTYGGTYDGGGSAWTLSTNVGTRFHPGQMFYPLLFHYDAANIIGVSNGGSVTRWPDAATGSALVQATSGAQPTFVTSDTTLNSLPAVAFNGTSQYMQNSNSLTPISKAKPYSIFMVYYLTAVSATYIILGFSAPGSGAQPNYEATTTHLLVNLGSAGINGPTTPASNTAYIAAIVGGSGNSVELGENKAAFASLTSGSAGADGIAGVTVGAGSSGATFAPIHVAELFAYAGSVSSGDYATIVAGLASKYNITTS